MARPRNPKRDEAFEIWKKSKGKKKLKDIAAELDVSDSQIRKWKNQDKWNDQLNGNVTKSKGNVTKRKIGAPKGNKNAIGNSGGAPKGNSNAVVHGLFSKYLPEETLAIANEVDSISPLDLLWSNIKLQFASIMRAQQIMFVENKAEMIKELKKQKFEVKNFGDRESKDYRQVPIEEEYEFQFAWDRQANFLNSQSRAMAELRSMLKQFNDMTHEDDIRLLEVEKMQVTIDKTKAEINRLQDDDSDQPIEIMIKRAGEDK